MDKEGLRSKLSLNDLAKSTNGTRPETLVVKRTLVLPDGKTIDFHPNSPIFMLLSKLLEEQPDGGLVTIPFENFLTISPEDRKERHLVDVRISNSRNILKDSGWTIVLSKRNDENGNRKTFVSLNKIKKPITATGNNQGEAKASAQESQRKNSKPRSPYFDPENARAFFEKLREKNPDLYEKDNGSLSTSSPATESPKDKVRS